jgi:hypothetical protein
MKLIIKTVILLALMSLGLSVTAQHEDLKLNPEKVKKFTVYMEHKHGGPEGFPLWKANNKIQYAKEMWYYTESFYVKRNHLSQGIVLNEEIIDISRFESYRKENDEAIVELPGFKDVLVLLPLKKLIYKP